jgi:hypothetical protein
MESDDRSQQAAAGNAEKTAATTGAGYGGQASSIASSLIPTLNYEATGNAGLTPTQKNNMLVAGQQGAGGATGSIVGEAGLAANRTRNSGALSGVQDAAARSRIQAASKANLGVENESTQIANQKQAQAQQQLQGLYGTDVNAQLKAMGLVPEDINADVNAGKSGWLQNTEGALNTIGGLGLGAAKAAGFGA